MLTHACIKNIKNKRNVAPPKYILWRCHSLLCCGLIHFDMTAASDRQARYLQPRAPSSPSTFSLDRYFKTVQTRSHQRCLSMVTSRQCRQHHIDLLPRWSPQDNADNMTSTLSHDRHLKTMQTTSTLSHDMVTSRQCRQHHINVVSRWSPQDNADNITSSLDRHLKTMQTRSHQRCLTIVTSRQCRQHHIDLLSR